MKGKTRSVRIGHRLYLLLREESDISQKAGSRLWLARYLQERAALGGVQHSGFENKMFWMEIFAIAGVLPVKTMLEDGFVERIRLAKFRSKTTLDCSVKLRLGTKLYQELLRRGVFTALSLRAAVH